MGDNAFDNKLIGYLGEGTLSGDAGSDTLTGGIDSDTFWFDTPLVAGSLTTITDFTTGASAGG